MNLRKLAVFLLLALALVACQSADAPAETPRVASSGGEPLPDGPECRSDSQCQGYLRCIDGGCAVPPAITGDVREDTPVARFVHPDGSEVSFYLELAVRRSEQARGLMFREEMRDDWGMLFIYNRDQSLSFWMRNTLIELDMIFISSAGEVVGIVERAEPLTETPRTVDAPARYVLEVNGGLASERGVVVGSKMSLEHVDEAHQPRE